MLLKIIFILKNQNKNLKCIMEKVILLKTNVFQAGGFVEHTGEHNINMFNSQSITTQDSSNDINQNTGVPRALSSENVHTENTVSRFVYMKKILQICL